MSKHHIALKNLLDACYGCECPDLSNIVIVYGKTRNKNLHSVEEAAEKAINALRKKGVILSNVKELAVNLHLPEDILLAQVNLASQYLASNFPNETKIFYGAVTEKPHIITAAIAVIK